MPVGSTVAKRGGLTTAVRTFRYHDFFQAQDPNLIEPYHCGQMMVVTRVSQTQWHVTTDVDPNTTYIDSLNNVVCVPGGPCYVGDVTQLDSPYGFLGNYHMGFAADIVCPKCPK
jgi:hypothetical protein